MGTQSRRTSWESNLKIKYAANCIRPPPTMDRVILWAPDGLPFGSEIYDFAGSGGRLHCRGIAVLWGALMEELRVGRYDHDGEPKGLSDHSDTLVILGALLLWFGWYIFNLQ